MKKVAIIIAPNWRDYAKKYLKDCLSGLREQTYSSETKLFLVDNETSAESLAYLKELVPEAEIIANANNDGFAKGNNDAIKLAIEQGYEYCVLFNMDTLIDNRAVAELVKMAESDATIGCVQARLMLWPDQQRINSLGNATHFLGFGYCVGYGENFEDIKDNISDGQEIFYPSGAAVLFKTEVLKTVGLLDEEMWMYNEDQDLGWRIWLAGYRCVLAKEAVVYHKYEFSKSIKKYYWMDRNRLVAIIKNYSLLTLILIFPALIFMELGLFYFSTQNGWFKEKLKVYSYFLKLSTWKYLLKERRKIQASRKIGDKEIAKMLSSSINYQEVESPALSIANKIFTAYWKVASYLIIW